MGFDNPIDAVGEMIDPDEDSLTVAGVVKDFNFRSLHTEIKPLAIRLSNGSQFGVKLSAGPGGEAITERIRAAYEQIYPASRSCSAPRPPSIAATNRFQRWAA
jgi:putative ABC transport system permease protein